MTYTSETKCKNCGRTITTLNKSLWGLDDLKAKFGNICSKCMTSEQARELELAIAHGIGKKYGK